MAMLADANAWPTSGTLALERPGSAKLDFHGWAYGNVPETRAAGQPAFSWISARPEYWPSAPGSPRDIPSVPVPCLGVLSLVFGVGAGGAGWVARLARSGWFAGLEPRTEDLVVAGGISAGCWTAPAGAAEARHVASQARSFVTQAPFPNAILGIVAIPLDATPGDRAVARGLVAGLRERRDATSCRLAVVATVEAVTARADAFARELRALGAFVVRAGLGATGDHFHHFPLRAAVLPRQGRLVCVDLADHLACWRPGGAAVLTVIPFRFDDAVAALRRLAVAGSAGNPPARALNLHLHRQPDGSGHLLVALDRLATTCQELLLRPGDDMVFTTADRLDDVTGSADLLVIQHARPPRRRVRFCRTGGAFIPGGA